MKKLFKNLKQKAFSEAIVPLAIIGSIGVGSGMMGILPIADLINYDSQRSAVVSDSTMSPGEKAAILSNIETKYRLFYGIYPGRRI